MKCEALRADNDVIRLHSRSPVSFGPAHPFRIVVAGLDPAICCGTEMAGSSPATTVHYRGT